MAVGPNALGARKVGNWDPKLGPLRVQFRV